MAKKIMCVGAGPSQHKGIVRAQELGLLVLATDGDPKAPGLAIADTPIALDVKDEKAHIHLAREHKIDGVMTIASDVTLMTVAAVSDALGLPGLSREVAERATDKELMRKAFSNNGVPSPFSFRVHSPEDALLRAIEIGFPVVVKPADSAGSRGVRYVMEEQGLQEAYQTALQYSRKKKVLIEAFMEGVEVSVEAFVVGGVVHSIVLSDKIRTEPPFLLDTQVTFPSACSKSIQQKVISVTVDAVCALGITDAPIHAEIMVTPLGDVIPVEIAARGPGFKVFTEIIPMVSGVDVIKAVINQSLGVVPELTFGKKHAASILFFASPKEGIVKGISGLERIQNIPGVYEAEVYARPGDSVSYLRSGSDRVGHVIIIADTPEVVSKITKQAKELFSLEVE